MIYERGRPLSFLRMKYIKISFFSYDWYLAVPVASFEIILKSLELTLSCCERVGSCETPSRLIEIFFVSDTAFESFSSFLEDKDIQLASFPLSIFQNQESKSYKLFCREEFFPAELPFYLFAPLLSFIAYQHIYDGVSLVHCAMITKDKNARLLVAKSGAGKSTCCKKVSTGWKEGADDLAILRIGPAEDKVIALPTWSNFLPWGKEPRKSWDISLEYVLESVYLLYKGEDRLLDASKHESALTIYSQLRVLWDHCDYIKYNRKEFLDKMEKLFDIAVYLVHTYDVHILEHSLNGDFCKTIEDGLKLNLQEKV